MDLEVLKVALQAVSTLSLVGGVVYAAFQLQAHKKAQHVANFTKLVEMQMALRRMRVEDPSLAQVYQHDLVGLKSERDVREHFFNLMQLSVFEIVWFSFRHGQVPRDYFVSWEDRMREIAGEPSFRRMLASPNMKILHDEFHAYMLEMLRRVPERASDPTNLAVSKVFPRT